MLGKCCKHDCCDNIKTYIILKSTGGCDLSTSKFIILLYHTGFCFYFIHCFCFYIVRSGNIQKKDGGPCIKFGSSLGSELMACTLRLNVVIFINTPKIANVTTNSHGHA